MQCIYMQCIYSVSVPTPVRMNNNNSSRTILVLTIFALALSVQNVKAMQPSYLICLKDVVPRTCLSALNESNDTNVQAQSSIVTYGTNPSAYNAWTLDPISNAFATTFGPQRLSCGMGVYSRPGWWSWTVTCQTQANIIVEPQDYYVQPVFRDVNQTEFTLNTTQVPASQHPSNTPMCIMRVDRYSTPYLAVVDANNPTATQVLFTRTLYTGDARGNFDTPNAWMLLLACFASVQFVKFI